MCEEVGEGWLRRAIGSVLDLDPDLDQWKILLIRICNTEKGVFMRFFTSIFFMTTIKFLPTVYDPYNIF